MDITSIINGLFPWIIVALIFFVISIFAYLICQRRKGPLQHQKISSTFILLLLFCWLIIVFGITTLSRAANYKSMINIHMFSGYINAWNKWSLSEFQLIIFNIIMFIPLGLLLPLYNDKFKRFIPTLLVSLGITLGIECIQLVTNMGIFELDDIFHNTLGGVIGFFLISGILDCIEHKKFVLKSVLKAIAIPMTICIIFLIALTIYSTKELGNMPILPAEKQNMKGITVNLETDLSEKASSVALYKNKCANNIENGKRIADILINEYQLTREGKIYIDGINRLFEFKDSTGQKYMLTYVLPDGTWTFTNLSNPEERKVSSSDEKYQKQSLEKWMKKNNILPNNVKYSLQEKKYLRWDVKTPNSIKTYSKNFGEGLIMVTPSEKNIPSSIFYSIIENTYIKNIDIISPKQAYEKIKNGDFDVYPGFNKGDTLNIKSVDISYVYDTKGYYQPVYQFKVQVNQVNKEDYIIDIKIPAMKNL